MYHNTNHLCSMIPTTGLWTTTQQQQRKRKRKPKNASVLLFTLCIERTSCSQLSLKMFLWFHNFRIFVPFWKLTLVVVNTIIRLDDEANAIFIFDYIFYYIIFFVSRQYPYASYLSVVACKRQCYQLTVMNESYAINDSIFTFNILLQTMTINVMMMFWW